MPNTVALAIGFDPWLFESIRKRTSAGEKLGHVAPRKRG
jgi:hypothetical protein